MAAMAVPVAQSAGASWRRTAPVPCRRRQCTQSGRISAAMTSAMTSAGCSRTRSTMPATGGTRLSRQPVRCSSSKPTPTATGESAGDKSTEEASSTAVSAEASGGEASSKEGAASSKEAVTEASMDSIGAEMARIRKAREAEQGPGGASGFAQGVLEEVRLIEWPGFSSVLSTTGLVLAVIVSATIAILIVNAILSELSDRIFSIEAVATLWGL